MTLAQKILRMFHPKSEHERMKVRETMARAQAEAEDVTRTMQQDSTALRLWLSRKRGFKVFSEHCEYRCKNGGLYFICKHDGHEAHASGFAQCNDEQCPLIALSKELA